MNRALKALRFLLFCGMAFAFLPANAQQSPTQSRAGARSNSNRGDEPLELEKDNLDRVAASTVQIKQVLVKDPGLLVELKRYVAKEATDNGQIVDDTELTDSAIFERLDRDVPFRSLATRLVQRYGYLLPSVNPDSDAGKQQELVLKERARRLVQVEAQEDAEAAAEAKKKAAEEEAADQCGAAQDQSCIPASQSKTRRSAAPRDNSQPPDRYTSPVPDQIPQFPSPQLLRTGGSSSSSDTNARGSTDTNALLQQFAGLQGDRDSGGMGSSEDSDSNNRAARIAQGMAAAQGMGGMGSGAFPLPLDLGSMADLNGSGNDGRSGRSGTLRSSDGREGAPRNSERRNSDEAELSPVSIVHKANPYADIPSLYDMYVQASARPHALERFGLDVFQNQSDDSDAIPMDLPVGPEYVVGPGDTLAIDVWGGISQRMFRTVDRAGRVSLPEAGPVLVSGRTLGEVQENVQQLLRTQYRDVSADVSLSKLRTVRVYVVGDVEEPGAYDISSLSTPLNALFAAGGVTQNGSLRSLQHYRGQQLVEEVDSYDLLLHGIRGDLKRLENGDTLRVPPIGPQVTIEGMVRRPAIYELHGETTLADALELSGGILPAAALQHIEVQRLEAHQKHTMLNVDVSPNSDAAGVATQLAAFKIQDGDIIHIFPIAPYNESAIYLQGHVMRPGRYSFTEGMKITDLISSYTDLLPEPAGHYAEIVRLNAPDFHPTVESFDLGAALKDPSTAPKLQRLDTVRIFSRFDFEPAPVVWVGGEVRSPGNYRTSGQAHIRDAIYLAGGASPDAAMDSAQLFRTEADGTLKIFSVNLGQALAGVPTEDLALEPRDKILIHRNSASVDPTTVWIKGEVAKPGRYPLTTNMRVVNLVEVAGGLKRSADPVSADLTHIGENDPDRRVGESTPVSLSAALNGDPKEDMPLHDGDVLTIRERAGWSDIGASVSVRGEVQHPGTYGIRPGERLSSVLERSGGFSPEGYSYGAVLMRTDVRELEKKSRATLVDRIRQEEVYLKAVPETDPDQRNAKLTAVARTETSLQQLEANEPIGRVVIHIQPDTKTWKNTSEDVTLRDGDVLVIPKKAGYVTVMGQVFNPTAVGYRSGRSANWYLSQSGGLTQLADKKAVFVVRADGSVLSAKNNSMWWSGDPMSATLRPGDSVIVPERAPNIGPRNLTTLLSAAQVAASAAIAVAYFIK
jgi:protein involved in polysaccharide export with SLBB domain